MKQNLNYNHLSVNAMKKENSIMYQLRLSNKYGRKTIGVGSNYLTALNIAQTVDDEINKQLSMGDDLDIDTLKELAKNELARFKDSKQRNIRVVEKDDIQVLWSKYVEYQQSLNTWCESTILTTVATVTSIINECPIQKLEQKAELVKWLFGDKSRKPKTSKDRLKWIVSAIDWNSKHGNIPRRWGIEYRDLLDSIKLKDIQSSKFKSDDNDELDIFSVAEIYQILEALKKGTHEKRINTHKQYYWYVYFLWLTGCRPSEAVALKWENIDLKKNRIKFCQNQVNASGKIVTRNSTKTVDFRYFPINTEIRNLLFCCSNFNDGYVFRNKLNKCISQQALNGVWRNLLISMNIKYRVPYQLRHTMISYHANNDYPIHKLAEIVGNSEKIIKEHYLKLDIEKIFLPDVIKEV